MTNVSLDTSDLRPSRRAAAPPPVREAAAARPRRLLVAVGIAFGAAMVAGAGFGAFTMLGTAPAPRSKIQFGPLAEMPEIRDGVPAVVRRVPVDLVERRTADVVPARPASVATPQTSERSVAAALAQRSAPPVSDPSADSANARAMASTLATAALRPSVAPPPREPAAPVRIVATKPVPSAPADTAGTGSTTVASLEPTVVPPAPAADVPRRDVDPVGSVQPAPAPARAATRDTVPAPSPPRSAAGETPLPPVRRVSRAFEAPAPAPPAPRQSPAAGPKQVTAAPAPAPAMARAAPREERAEIFGMPLPGFVPTGRQIRDAAGSVADAVTSIPDVF